MAKQHSFRNRDVRVRESVPGYRPQKEGVQVLCPFCNPPHPLVPGMDSPCGTSLKVTAVQAVLTAHSVRQKKLHCVKCGKGDGEMVKYRNGYVHLQECAPEKRLLPDTPKFSLWARIVFHMRPKLRQRFERAFGKTQLCKEINADGQETGKTLGYFFFRPPPQQVKNG